MITKEQLKSVAQAIRMVDLGKGDNLNERIHESEMLAMAALIAIYKTRPVFVERGKIDYEKLAKSKPGAIIEIERN